MQRVQGATPSREERAERATTATKERTPRAVTRGESPRSAGPAKVDWLNATFDGTDASLGAVIHLLARVMQRPVSSVEGGGMLGFSETHKLLGHVGSRRVHVGCVARGGESQNGRWLVQLTGHGCGLVRDWALLHDALVQLDARITRLDLALDFYEGEVTVDDAVCAYEGGGFDGRGRPPSCSLAGDWLRGQGGRTLYVGKATNGKMLRVYEKGKQLGDPAGEWVRFEVQLGACDRVIPLDALLRPDEYLAGTYPAMADLIGIAGEAIPTYTKGGIVALAHLLHHMRRSYGKLLDVLATDSAAKTAELVEEVRIVGLPRRLDPSCAAAGVPWADVLAQLERY